MHHPFKAWKRAWRAFAKSGGHGMWGGCGPGGRGREHHGEEGFEGAFGGGGGFGVRRPLRFLAHQLGLDERQIGELARILDGLKTERAQAEVDQRRTVAAFADALAGESFDGAKASQGGELRVKSAERLRDAVLKALQQIHSLLNADQRVRLAYMIRTGRLGI
jgi:Spy/CpxP family protein refolding chaperone